MEGTADPEFRAALRASVDFVYHAERYFKDPGNPELPLILEPWQKREMYYCQWGEGFDDAGMSIRKPLAINSPRGFGKSVFASVIADEFALHFPHTKIALFSTSQDQANDLMEKCRYFVKHSDLAIMLDRKRDNKSELGFVNGSLIKSFPQSEVTIRGFHPHIKIIDEKARIRREILESAIRPMGRKVCWLEVGISTPFGRRNNHYEDCMNTEGFRTSLLGPTDVSWVDEEKLKVESSRMGDRLARQELFAEFLADEDTVFQPLWIDRMMDPRLEWAPHGYRGWNYVIGLDIAQYRDYAAFCVMHEVPNKYYQIDLLERWQESYTFLANRSRELCELFDAQMIIPDATGVGAGVIEMIEHATPDTPMYHSKIKKGRKRGERPSRQARRRREEQWRPGFVFTNVAKINLVDEMKRVMMANKLRCPHHRGTTDPEHPYYISKVFEDECLDFQFYRTATGITYGHPEDGKSHDDVIIAVMLALWGLRVALADTGTPKIGGAVGSRTMLDRHGRPIGLTRR